YIISRCQEQVSDTQTGRFGAEMQVELVNDGPFTVILE
ncbi:MAG: D-aminoacyl-tRNA deacylase, partial [Clostridia bacterium]